MSPLATLILLSSTSAAFVAPRMNFQVSVNFPGTTLGDAVRLIHSPERWGDGRGSLFGIPSFIPRDVEGPAICGLERMVTFSALGHRVRLIGNRQQGSKVQITAPDCEVPHTTVFATVIPVQEGVMMELNVVCDYPVDATYVAQMMRLGLFAFPDDVESEHYKLVLYRQGLRSG